MGQEGDAEERWHSLHWGQSDDHFEEDLQGERETQLAWEWEVGSSRGPEGDPLTHEDRKRLLVALYEKLVLLARGIRYASNMVDQDKGSKHLNLRILEFLEEVYRLSAAGRVHAAGDLIYDFTQKALRREDFEFCDQLFGTIDVPRLDPALRITFLSMTLNAKTKLRERDRYYTRVHGAFAAERGEDGASKLLSKYK